MQDKFNLKKFEKIIFFIMMWVFFSLNSKYLRLPFPQILRWVFLGILVGCVLLFEKARLGGPPKLLLFYIVAVIPSIINSNDRSESVIKILSLIIVLWGVYSYFQSLQKKEEMESAIKNILCIAILFEIQSIGCLFIGLGNGDRAMGVTSNSNTLGIYSNLSLLAGAYFLNNTKDVKERLFFIGIMIASAVTAIMSGSRAALVTLFLNIVVCAFIRIKSSLNRLVFILLVGTFGVLLMTGTLGDFGIPALQKLLEGETTRGELWEKAIDVWKMFPLFGCGYSVSASYNDVDLAIGRYDFHNSYLTILAEIGVWGSALLVVGFLLTLKGTFKNDKKKGKFSIWRIVLLMIVELAVAAWSESFLFAVGSTEACLFWVLFAWLASYNNRQKEIKLLKKEALRGE